MDLHTFSETLAQEDANRMRAHMERVQREEREWMEARLHASLHGNWQDADECPVCVEEASR